MHPLPRAGRLPAGLALIGVAALAVTAAGTATLSGPVGATPTDDAADVARAYRADSVAADAEYGRTARRVAVRADRVTPEPGRCVWVEQTDVTHDGAAVAEVRVPWHDRGAVRPGGVVVVRVIPRGYDGGRIDLGFGIPE